MRDRVTLRGIREAVEQAKTALKTVGKKEIVLVFDSKRFWDSGSPREFMHILYDSQSNLEDLNIDDKVFVLCFNLDYLAVKFVEIIKNTGAKYISARDFIEPKYTEINSIAHDVFEHCEKQIGAGKRGYAPEQWEIIMQAIEICKDLEGDYVEIGTFQGASAKVAFDYYNCISKKNKCYFIDTFEGFNYERASKSQDICWNTSDHHRVKDMINIAKNNIDSRKHENPTCTYELVRSNIFEDSIPKEIKNISVCNIDVDMYDAVLECLKICFPKMISGGILIVQDPGRTPYCLGSRIALEEFINELDSNEFSQIYFPSSGQHIS